MTSALAKLSLFSGVPEKLSRCCQMRQEHLRSAADAGRYRHRRCAGRRLGPEDQET